MDFLSSNSFLMLEKSLGYLWTKQAAIADNIANAETPEYKEKVVTFEDSLKSKLLLASRRSAPVKSMRRVLESTPFSVTDRNSYQMRYVISPINSDLAILNSAIRGQ